LGTIRPIFDPSERDDFCFRVFNNCTANTTGEYAAIEVQNNTWYGEKHQLLIKNMDNDPEIQKTCGYPG
jgi:hypothetical protein